MRDTVAITESVFDAAFEAVRKHHAALREAEHQIQKANEKHSLAVEQVEKTAKRVEHWTKARDAERLELGRALAKVRSKWPARGPNAKGWGEYLEKEGIPQQTAWEYMEKAGWAEDISLPRNIGSENSETPDAPDLPTRREIAAARQSARAPAPPENDNRFSADIDTTPSVDLRLGDWRITLADVGTVDAVIADPPYSERTHAAATTRADGTDAGGLTPSYSGWTPADVADFVAYWSTRCRGWIVALTDSELIPAWRDAYRAAGRYAFAPVPCVITGMSVRISGDGPSSWAVYAMVSRPAALIKWGTLPGAYVGNTEHGAGGGRGKPSWLMDSLIRDYTRAGDLVCDPMAGFGSTLFSALRQGCRAVGSEIDSDVREQALARAREELQKPSKAPRQ